MSKVLKLTAFVAVCVVHVASVQAATIDLITNGDFEAGNSGFTSDLTYVPGVNTGAAQYDVDTTPKAWNGAFVALGDNTSGFGNMMMVNGSQNAGDVVWSQTVSVVQNTTYTFGAWIADLFSGSSRVGLNINGSGLGSITAPSSAGMWDEYTLAWNSGTATSATLSLLQETTGFGGNDFALDDISFTTNMAAVPPVPLPASAWLLVVGLAGLLGLRRSRIA